MKIKTWQVQCIRSLGTINGIKSPDDPINQRHLHLGAFALLKGSCRPLWENDSIMAQL
jgi:hypothetical protein